MITDWQFLLIGQPLHTSSMVAAKRDTPASMLASDTCKAQVAPMIILHLRICCHTVSVVITSGYSQLPP